MAELSLLDNAIGAIISCAGSYMACELYSAFIVLVKLEFGGPVALHTIGPDMLVFSSISPSICFGAQMNRLLETALLRSHS